jgi:hypothetical protein
MNTVFVAVYEYRNGNSIRVFQNRSDALAWADEIADEYWSDLTDAEPRPEDWRNEYWRIAGETYHSEWFRVEECPLE